MSGTSLDGIDAALVDIQEAGDGVDWRIVAFETVPYTTEQRDEIHQAILRGDAARLSRLHARLGEWFAEAALRVCDVAGVDPATLNAIGSHGQTVWHQPPSRDSGRGHTLQLGDSATIAERTGAPVVADFRSRDVAAGGEGAPLVAWVDRFLFAGDAPRVLQNIGGMANLTLVPPRGSSEALIAFDTGPGNALVDAAVELATDGAAAYDEGGAWAARGAVDEALLAELLGDPFFEQTPPRSTGREKFGRAYVEELVDRIRPGTESDWADLIATLTALTARSVAGAIRRWAHPGDGGEVIVTGGGANNPVMVEMTRAALTPLPLRTGDALGFDPAAKEAVAFAVLAWAHLHGRAANVPTVTGAVGPRILGSLTPGGRS